MAKNEYERRWSLVNTRNDVTLDGVSAKISGIYNDCATVWSDENIDGVMFSWKAVERIVNSDGKFSSR